MKKMITLLLVLMMTLTMAACADKTEPTGDPADESGQSTPSETTEPTGDPADESGQSTPSETTEPTTPEPTDAIARQDGDRYEAVIVIEAMEETVNYQYVRNESAGFEMAFDYDSFVRRSESDRECFVSSYDDPKDPQNYLEVAYSAEDAEDVAAAIRNNLSQTYDLLDESRELYQVGSCIYIETSELKGTGTMPDKLQMVYIIPANDGCRVATAHCIFEGAEGFGVRFSAMLNTLTVLDTQGERSLSSEQALSAVKRYCTISNPDLESIVNAGEYPVFWEITESSEEQIVVLFRSYTGAEVRFYVDPVSGETHVTEFVSGVTAEEEQTDVSLNLWDYLDWWRG